MLKNYLKIALRNIKRYKGYSFINITGLAIGMTCTILILLWVQDELSYDRFHKNGDYLYRVIQDIQFTDHRTHWAITQGPLGPSLKEDFPEIADFTRIRYRGFRFKYDDKVFDEGVCMADNSILEMFTFPLVQGDAKTALIDPNNIVLSEKMAEKYFGGENPIGKTLKADDRYDFHVTGVFKKIPTNSHLQFDFLIPFIFGRELGYTVDTWNNSGFSTYVMLAKTASVENVIGKISDYLKRKPTLEENSKLMLQPLKRVHLYSHYDFDFAHGDIKYVMIFSIVALFILLIACFNFMNLATARAGNRAKEIGMRKVAGAYKRNIIYQFFGEAIFLSLIALFFSLIFVELLLPIFNGLSGKERSLNFTSNSLTLIGLIGITLITGIISGSYPALVLSTFKPVDILKGSGSTTGVTGSGKRGALFRKVLVVSQFAVSIMLLIGTIIVSNQLEFMRNKKLGYEKEHLIMSRMRAEMSQQFEAVKNEFLKNPDILNVTAVANPPTYGYVFSNTLWHWEGQKPDEEILFRCNLVNYDYFKTFGLELFAGRPFSKEFASDTNTVIINETAMKAMRLENPVGKRLAYQNGEFNIEIIGVVKDYHFRSLHQRIEPLILILSTDATQILCARILGTDIPRTINEVEQVWKKFAPDFPFEYNFLDETLDNLYRSEMRVSKIFRYFTALAIFISCLGLFGLASFMAEQRTKEIGIRKVVGASVLGIVLLLSKEFAKWVLVANLIAWPIAWYVMSKWLQNFAYRTNIAWTTFIFSAGVAVLIALLTVSYKSIRAAVANPVESLRYE
jgi:putative ABC transport system permease protein